MAKNLDTVFPFYDAVTEQYRYRDDQFKTPYLAFAALKPNPWIIRREHSAGVAAEVELYFVPLDGGTPIQVHGTDANVTVSAGTTYDYIYCSDNLPAALPVDEAGYYLKVVDTHPATDKEYFSETFSVHTSVSDLLKLEFKNDTILNGINQYFIQVLYVNNILKTPQYIREDTGDKRNGVLVREKQVMFKLHTLHMPVTPEYIVDALMLLPMMDYVWVTPPSGTQTLYTEVRVPDPEWQATAAGCYAKMEINFIDSVVVKKLNYRELRSEDDTMSAIIKTGVGATVADDEVFSLTVTFDEDMPDTNYTPYAYVISSSAPVDVQIPYLSDITVSGFTITTIVACTVRWSAIHENN